MNRFKWPLLILIPLVVLVLASVRCGLFAGSAPTSGAIQVTTEQKGPNETLHILLSEVGSRTHWHKNDDHYRVDIRRRGPDLYRFDIALLDPHSDVARTMRGATQLESGSITLGGFTFDAHDGQKHQSVVLEVR